MDWMLLPLRRYAEFSGRSRRTEYWLFFLFTAICGAVLAGIDKVLGLQIGQGRSANGILSSLFNLATLVPTLAVNVRRLHDVDRSGWWLLLPLGTGIGGAAIGLLIGAAAGNMLSWATILGWISIVIVLIVLFVFQVTDGDPGANRFGEDPKARDGERHGSE